MRPARAKLGIGRFVREALHHVPGPLMAAGLGVLVALAIVFSSPTADARSAFDSGYGFERTYNAALRMVHIDMGLKITEKDDKTGFLVFDYKSPDTGNKISSGTIEFIRPPHEGDGPVQVVVQLPQMPRAHEQVLVDTLVRKMHQEYGDPPPRPKAQPAPAKPPPGDAGADGEPEGDAEAP
jgi:hypothetical protein